MGFFFLPQPLTADGLAARVKVLSDAGLMNDAGYIVSSTALVPADMATAIRMLLSDQDEFDEFAKHPGLLDVPGLTRPAADGTLVRPTLRAAVVCVTTRAFVSSPGICMPMSVCGRVQ